jgi:hypothetical protein
MRSLAIWLIGLVSCLLFVGALLPMEGPVGRRWVMPLGVRGTLFFVGGCCLILMITYLVDKYWRNGKNRN